MNTSFVVLLFLEVNEWISLGVLLITMMAGFALIFYRLGIMIGRFTSFEVRASGLEEFLYSRVPVIDARLDGLELRVERLAADCEPGIRAFPVLVQKVSELSIRVNELSRRMDILTQRVNEIAPKVEVMWSWRLASHQSPPGLNEEGRRLLLYLGPKFVDEFLYGEILMAVKSFNPENRYQVQQQLIKVVAGLASREGYRQFLESIAYEAGCSVEMLLYVVAIDIRDRVFTDLNLNIKLLSPNT